MSLLDKYLPKTDFESYDDFYKNYQINIPENFNFAYDVVDQLANEKANERALQWCDDKGAERTFTFAEIKTYSDKAAGILSAAGIGKGDPVMLILKHRWEYLPVLLALHKLGAIAIPVTHLLSTKDIVYICNAADIKGIICVDDLELMKRVNKAEAVMEQSAESHGIMHLRYKAYMRSIHTPNDYDPAKILHDQNEARSKAVYTDDDFSGSITDGAAGFYGSAPDAVTGFQMPEPLLAWVDFCPLLNKAGVDFKKPDSVNKNTDIMLLYFTSGTTGMPKMVSHDFTYPLWHIAAAKYWHQSAPERLHLTIADTGRTEAAWDCIYGQWLCGAGIFIYDYSRFVPSELLDIISRYKLTSFCASPAVYRFFINEDLKKYNLSALKHCSVIGEPLNPEIFDRFFAGTGIKLRECYGQTELTVSLCTWSWMEPKPGSMGKPAPGCDIDLLREDGTSCGIGEEGQIVLKLDKRKPYGMFSGYYRDEALTSSVWRENIYYTGDVAWKDENGCYWFVRRNDEEDSNQN